MTQMTTVEYSTYARTILSELGPLATLIRQYSATNTPTNKPIAINQLLDLEQIHVALTNPQNTLKPSMAAYAVLLKTHREILSFQELTLLQKHLTEEAIDKLNAKIEKSTTEAQIDEYAAVLVPLERTLAKLVKTQRFLLDIEERLEAFEQHLGVMSQKYDKQWHKYRAHFLRNLTDELITTGVELNSIEKTDLARQETWPELLLRFRELNLGIPDYLNIVKPDFTTYFKLKAYLVTHSSLSRRMLPNKPEDIDKVVKKLLKH